MRPDGRVGLSERELTVTARATIGGVTVEASRAFGVEWLAAVQLELYYQDASTRVRLRRAAPPMRLRVAVARLPTPSACAPMGT